MNKLGMRASAIAVASCLTLAGAALDASAAGLGKIVVLSSLGQPLRAEIELTASRDPMHPLTLSYSTLLIPIWAPSGAETPMGGEAKP